MRKLFLGLSIAVIGALAVCLFIGALFGNHASQVEPYELTQARTQAEIAKIQQDQANSQFWSGFFQVFFAVLAVIIVIGLIVGLVWLVSSQLHRQNLEKLRLQKELMTLQPDHLGNYPAMITPGGIVRLEPGNYAQPVPHSFTYSPHNSSKTGALEQPGQAPALTGAAATVPPTFSELLSQGKIGKESGILLGFTTGEKGQLEEMRGSWNDLYSSLIAGISGSGKTTTTRFLVAQAILMGAKLLAIDPHGGADNDDSLTKTLLPLKAFLLCDIAIDDKDILGVLHIVSSELESRKKGKKGEPLILCVDELTSLMRRDLAPELSKVLQDISQEGRKFGVFALCMGQIFKGSTSGGTELRDSFASAYVHRLKSNQARLLLPPDEARLVVDLKPGQAMLSRTNGDFIPAYLPLTTGLDLERLAAQISAGNKPDVSREYAIIEAKPATAEDMRISSLFSQGKSIADIAKEIYGVSSNAGAKYQKASADIQDALRRSLPQN